MSSQRPDEFYVEKGAASFTCCYCECVEAAHACGWKCPIFNDNPICSQCCLVDALRKDAPKIFSEKLGREITREEINAICNKCGRNHATEDDALADNIQANGFNTEPEKSDDQKTNG